MPVRYLVLELFGNPLDGVHWTKLELECLQTPTESDRISRVQAERSITS